MASIFFATLLTLASVKASPALVSRQSITALTTPQIVAFTPYTYYAAAAYCPPSKTSSWTCGVNCDNNIGFQPVALGGDGNSVQFWYVGFDPNLNTVIVAHQGTDATQALAFLTSTGPVMGGLDSSLFPGLSSDIEVESALRDKQATTASDILSSVQTAMSQYGANSVTLVGHSLGAAISLLDSVYLPLHLPSGTTFRTILYGLPRVGNQAFADYVDANLHVTHINNLKDPIPITPGRFLGYVHPSGEIHIRETGEWVACPGQDNPSTECTIGDVPNVFEGNEANDPGPYNGIEILCAS